jgi:hypothetical protein
MRWVLAGTAPGKWALYLDERTGVAEIFSVFGDGIAIQTGMAWIFHKVCDFLLAPLFPQFADMQPMSCRILTFGFHGS